MQNDAGQAFPVAGPEAWQAAWQPLIDAIAQGTVKVSTEQETAPWAPDLVEAGAIRRWLDALEFDCPLHTDRDAALAQGFTDIVAPATSLSAFTTGALRQAGQSLFTNADRNAQPPVHALRPPLPPMAPQLPAYFATDMEFDYLRPVAVGERLRRRTPQVVACVPKKTKVGRGAFITFEALTESSLGDVVLRSRYSLFCYEPHSSGST